MNSATACRCLATPAVLLLALSTATVSAQTTCPAVWGARGNATYYDASSGGGTCTLPVGDGLTAALSSADFGSSEHCGECLEVTGPLGSVVVRVTDRCTACLAGNLDLSEPAFSAIADPLDGVASIAWHRVACPVSGHLAFAFQGSNPYYIKLQARDHRYGIASMDLQSADGATYQPMARTGDNFFQASAASPLNGSITVRLTATSGEVLEQTLPGIDNGSTLPGSDQFADCGLLFRDGFEGY